MKRALRSFYKKRATLNSGLSYFACALLEEDEMLEEEEITELLLVEETTSTSSELIGG